jgi:hypothetical protein
VATGDRYGHREESHPDDIHEHFVKEGQVVSRASRATDKFMHGIKVLMAKNYVDNLAEEVKKGLQREGRARPWAHGRAHRLRQ